MPTLRIFHQGVLRSEETLEADGVVIGRGDDVSLRLVEAKLSRRHVSITPDGHQWVLEDLASRNGTFVNGRKETRRDLVDGDRIELGAYVLQFRRPAGEFVPFGFRADDEGGTSRPRTGVVEIGDGATQYRPGRRDGKSTEGVDPRDAARVRQEARALLGPRLVERVAGTVYPLTRQTTTVGEGSDCDACVKGIGYDLAATIVRKDDGAFEIQKAGWLSRVRVNDVGVSTATLQPGDFVRIGKIDFEFDVPLS